MQSNHYKLCIEFLANMGPTEIRGTLDNEISYKLSSGYGNDVKRFICFYTAELSECFYAAEIGSDFDQRSQSSSDRSGRTWPQLSSQRVNVFMLFSLIINPHSVLTAITNCKPAPPALSFFPLNCIWYWEFHAEESEPKSVGSLV